MRISIADSDLPSEIADAASISDCLEQVEAREGMEEEDDVVEVVDDVGEDEMDF
ncbi:uncharacterized protein G2W53_034101 [Senna tora]|uniref:Uncharacterized protein n=1 Tax=Senna tora TaxID=362788 RepID=A0A834W7H5_9FABA|nr:uncharacterized protein G2W53_034101 [Senna tora]